MKPYIVSVERIARTP